MSIRFSHSLVTAGGIAILLWWLYGIGAQPAKAEDIRWETLSAGISVSVWNPGTSCMGTPPALIMVRVDPEQYRFSTYYFRDEGMPAPLTIQEWQHYTGDVILFNAGLFFEDFSYMGLLYKDGRPLNSKAHPYWKGLFVAEPLEPNLKKARILDLDQESFSTDDPHYRSAAQSLMLIDEQGKPRVRKSSKRAHQTIVAEEVDGSILLIKTADAVTLWDLALCLGSSLRTIRHAMAMDGGSSSDLLLAGSILAQRQSPGVLQAWEFVVDGTGSGHIPLPTVIGLSIRPDRPSGVVPRAKQK